MSKPRRECPKPNRTFQPDLQEPLEKRELLSSTTVRPIDEVRLQPPLYQLRPFLREARPLPFLNQLPAAAQVENRPFLFTQGQIRQAGRAVEVTDVDGEHYLISATGGGVVVTYKMLNGQVGVSIEGSNDDTVVLIQKLARFQPAGIAHRFSPGMALQDGTLTIGAFDVPSGRFNSILGFHTAKLAGPLTVSGTGVVDRIAFNEVLPGGGITVGGTLNTLDILDNAEFRGAERGITVGRNLNLFNTGADLTFGHGAQFHVGDSLGAELQLAKGTGESGSTGGTIFPGVDDVSVAVRGDFTLEEGSFLTVDTVVRPVIATGTITGVDQIIVAGGNAGFFDSTGVVLP